MDPHPGYVAREKEKPPQKNIRSVPQGEEAGDREINNNRPQQYTNILDRQNLCTIFVLLDAERCFSNSL